MSQGELIKSVCNKLKPCANLFVCLSNDNHTNQARICKFAYFTNENSMLGRTRAASKKRDSPSWTRSRTCTHHHRWRTESCAGWKSSCHAPSGWNGAWPVWGSGWSAGYRSCRRGSGFSAPGEHLGHQFYLKEAGRIFLLVSDSTSGFCEHLGVCSH